MKERKYVPEESLVRIFINGEFFSALLCTPKDLKELAIGWLFNQGFIASIRDIATLGVCEDMRDIHICLTDGSRIQRETTTSIRTSACTGGEISYDQFFRKPQPVEATITTPIDALRLYMKRALSMTVLYKETGGVHFAALTSATEDQNLICFEDVGRHNGVDKSIGRLLLTQQTSDDKILLTSGRISSEIVLKAANSGIQVIASITTSTDLAVRIAEDVGLTLVGRVLTSLPAVLCGQHRITTEHELDQPYRHFMQSAIGIHFAESEG